MGAFSYLRNVYDLDSLDTRFTVSSTTPYRAVVEARGDAAAASKERAAKWNSRPASSSSSSSSPSSPSPSSKPRWNTPEFYLYYVVFVVAIPYMFWITYDASKATHPNYGNYERYLSPGWIRGRKIDVTDSQYRTFRNNIPYLAALVVFHPLLRRLYNGVVYRVNSGGQASRPTLEEADQRLNQRASFDFGFAIIYLLALHGVSVVKILAILYLNYQVATNLPRKSVPVATWVFNVGILFANELGKGYKFKDIASLLWVFLSGGLIDESNSSLVNWGRWLDSYGGLMGRWEILFNITVLRLISFNLDYYWSLDRRGYSPIEKQLDPSSLSERDRVLTPAQSKDFSFRNYVAYAIYAPLYLTGPIITFNDYISQLRYKPASVELSRTIRYGLRFAFALLAMEIILHYDYVQAIAKFSPRWASYTAAQLCLLSYFNLHLIWLKLLLPWRFFRLWSLVDGIDPPENIIRCVSNNWSTLAFWRSWHRSFYRWSLRYIYVPLGGSSFSSARNAVRSVLTYVLVFTFVALWHDIQLRLLIWGWLIVLFMLPEMVAGSLFPKRRWEDHPTAYRMLCCAGAVVNVFMMMTANLVGFAFGIDGLRSILAGIFEHFSGYVFLSMAYALLFVGVQVMFEIRESEMRRGINLKC
ncbi:MBOAT, membrane-bound O-acyltransferase family-domain-containing protein [Xylaria sp. FL1777]|nr:MBOAT, membrane-bound O-acyltransferase family-domain-containing protein [Xylaria sp. FL1777]